MNKELSREEISATIAELIAFANKAMEREGRTDGFQDGDIDETATIENEIAELQQETEELEVARDVRQEEIDDSYNNGYLDGTNDTHTISANQLTINQLIEKIVGNRLRETRLLDDTSVRVLKGLTEIQLMRGADRIGGGLEYSALSTKAKLMKSISENAGDSTEDNS